VWGLRVKIFQGGREEKKRRERGDCREREMGRWMETRFVCNRRATRAMSRWTAFFTGLIIMHMEVAGFGDYLGGNKLPKAFILIFDNSQNRREEMGWQATSTRVLEQGKYDFRFEMAKRK